jgi:hypothetical protein
MIETFRLKARKEGKYQGEIMRELALKKKGKFKGAM